MGQGETVLCHVLLHCINSSLHGGLGLFLMFLGGGDFSTMCIPDGQIISILGDKDGIPTPVLDVLGEVGQHEIV